MRNPGAALSTEAFASRSGTPASASTAARPAARAATSTAGAGTRSGSRSISRWHVLLLSGSGHPEVGLHGGAFRGFVFSFLEGLQGL